MSELPLEYVERTVVDELKNLIHDRTVDRGGTDWHLPASVVLEIEDYVGPRLMRLALRAAGYRPFDDDDDGWYSSRDPDAELTAVEGLEPVDFGLVVDQLDVDGRLQAALGLR